MIIRAGTRDWSSPDVTDPDPAQVPGQAPTRPPEPAPTAEQGEAGGLS